MKPGWYVFDDRCAVMGPFPSKEKAESAMRLVDIGQAGCFVREVTAFRFRGK